jgi:hypothetical protein
MILGSTFLQIELEMMIVGGTGTWVRHTVPPCDATVVIMNL